MASGHPKGLYFLSFTEMWERFAFYVMVFVLLLYATDVESGGLGLSSAAGNEIYGLYLAFVYFTPFLGGMTADRYFGYRKSVLLGGMLMAAGLFLMSVPGSTFFVSGLVLLVIGNGFFKPNISVMVGNLYQPGDPKRDAGFNIFYVGINVGAFFAGFLAPVIRNEFGWLWTFRVAAFGLLIGVSTLLLSWRHLRSADRKPVIDPEDTGTREVFLKILAPAFGVGILTAFLYGSLVPNGALRPPVVGFLAGMIPVVIYFVRLGLHAKPAEKPGLLALLPLYLAGATFFMILHLNGSAMTQWARDFTDRDVRAVPESITIGSSNIQIKGQALPSYYANAPQDTPRPDPRSLLRVEDGVQARMYGQQRMDENAVSAVLAANHGQIEVVEVNGQTDPGIAARAVSVYENGTVTIEETTDSHGAPMVTATIPDGALAVRRVAFVREIEGEPMGVFLVDKATYAGIYDRYRQRFGKEPAYLPPGQYLRVVNPEQYQSLNPIFVIAFTPLVVWFFAMMVRRRRGISTARKIFLGMCVTTVSLLSMALAGFLSDGGAYKVSGLWLASFYALVTIGELCLSPMGLSLVTKLTPPRLVGLAMGGWFMAVAFGNNFSGFFGGIQGMMEPTTFFLVLAGVAALVALFIFLLLPRLDAAIKQYGA